jgi:hypothetical protein
VRIVRRFHFSRIFCGTDTSKLLVKTVLVSLLSFVLSLGGANFVWAHGAGGGGGGAGAGGGAGGAGSHGGANGNSMGVGHGASMGFGHSSHGATFSTRGSHSHNALSHHGKSHHTAKSLANHSRTHRHSAPRTHLAQTATLRGQKKGFIDGLPPGQELQVDRGRSLSPGWQSKVGPGTVLTDTDTVADQALRPGQETQVDRGQAVAPTTNP